MHELRKDPLLLRWVAVLERSSPPEEYESLSGPKTGDGCILCPGKEKDALSVRDSIGQDGSPEWLVQSVESAMPVLVPEGGLGRQGIGLYDRMNSIGVNEIVIESPEHATPPEDMGDGQMERVVRMYSHRMTEIAKDERIRYILVFKNAGSIAGPVGTHPHSQIIATPIIPLRMKAELDGAKAYYAYKERCIFCDIRDEELRTNKRVVIESEHFIVFCPFASRFPFETCVVPKRHSCEFQSITPEETKDLGEVLASVLRKMRKVLREPSYSYVIHTAPMRIPRRNHWHTLGDDFHWHMEIVPRLMTVSGFEWGSGFYVLTTSPENAARYLREA